jgi:hypothetical protein
MLGQHFIIWMRTAGLPTFRKLWGKVYDLEPGFYHLEIQNNYDVSKFGGTKTFFLSTTNKVGGQNYLLAVCYIVVGAFCSIFAFIFFLAYIG